MTNFERHQVESSLSFTCRFRPRLGAPEKACSRVPQVLLNIGSPSSVKAAMPSAAAKANTRAISWS